MSDRDVKSSEDICSTSSVTISADGPVNTIVESSGNLSVRPRIRHRHRGYWKSLPLIKLDDTATHGSRSPVAVMCLAEKPIVDVKNIRRHALR